MIWLGARSRIGTRTMRRKAFLQIVLPPQAVAEGDPEQLAAQLAPLFGHDLAEQPPIVTAQLLALRAYDATPRLGELAGIPTLVVSAVYDPIAPPRIGRSLADGIPGARYVEIPDASHGVPIHDPERINALLLDHFRVVDKT
jgi:pimeloyl-ACP methyl ester carboxylesterase